VGALIDLGAGFHPDLTGRENVFINGVISGLTRREVARNFDSIVAFAELEQFIDSPIRIYSLGMQMRLAFAIAVHIQPAILLIDEVLAVGDVAFQGKCLDRIAHFKAQGCTVLLVSHDTSLVSQLCDEVLWLQEGRLAAHGTPDEVVNQYLAEMKVETRRRTPDTQQARLTSAGIELKLNENRFGSLEMEIEEVSLCDAQGEPALELDSGDALSIIIDYVAHQPISGPIFGATISREDGLVCWEGNTQSIPVPDGLIHGRGRVILHLNRLDLIEGQYFVDVGVYQHDWSYAYDYHWHVYSLIMHSVGGQQGILMPPHSWEFRERRDTPDQAR
jgi:lipopolysaccharide transport system ATP-binding protein